YLLAAFDVLTVSASLFLNHRIMQIYVRSVASNREWAERSARYSALGQLAAEVNAPGNDVFDSQDVAGEAVRLQRARLAFQRRLAELRAELPAEVRAEDAALLRGRMEDIERAMDEMTAESSLIFSYFAGGHNTQAGERMATMDRKYARLLAALRELTRTVSSIQQREFQVQGAAAAQLQRFEYLIAALILIMVGAATVYGQRMWRNAAGDARERAVYIEQLRAAEESLRKAHAHLEQRVQERTQALRSSESALRAAAAEWQRTFEAIESPVLIVDAEGRAVRLNRAALELAGRDPEALTGQPLAEIAAGEPWAAAAGVAARSRQERGTAEAQARDAGSGRTWDVSANLVQEGDGRGGERVIVVARDVTRLVELQESVRREERMSAMGSLVAGVAHEVRNPLFGITSTLDAFEARHGAGGPFEKYLALLRRETERLSTLMRDLLDYGRPPGLDMTEVDFASVVDDAVQLCAPIAGPAGVTVAREGAADGARVRLDRWRIQQALQNLIQNAVQHSPRGGTVRVQVGAEEDGRGRQVFCAVRDSGPGFKPEDLPHLFEPFFTRRPGGTGMGLSLAQRIVAQHGG
ncbi:MAG TPA: ATP-binding protein, partial [Vicinamibacteria bacterium]|nr:ATP-binding protein [Vicinamibacteria bacterium]